MANWQDNKSMHPFAIIWIAPMHITHSTKSDLFNLRVQAGELLGGLLEPIIQRSGGVDCEALRRTKSPEAAWDE